VNEPLVFIELLDQAATKTQLKILAELATELIIPNQGRSINDQLLTTKKIHVRITKPNDCKELKKTKVPKTQDIHKLIFFKGTVIRTGMIKMVKTEQTWHCDKCKHIIVLKYNKSLYNEIEKPTKCPSDSDGECNSKKFTLQNVDEFDFCKDYQEIKVQEQVTKLEIGNIPTSIAIILEDDLVDTVKAGDDVEVGGYVIQRWKRTNDGDRCKISLCIVANHVYSSNTLSDTTPTFELEQEFEDYWNKNGSVISKRDFILKSFCPNVYGMYYVKLAVMMVLVGGIAVEDQIRIRGDSHMLLVGDPGVFG
jgi:DNA helicase MCM9